MPVASITKFSFTDHARLEMARRQISEAEVAQFLSSPEHSETVTARRQIFQSRIRWSERTKTYLLRVVVDLDREVPTVVTVYRTSKLSKYERGKA